MISFALIALLNSWCQNHEALNQNNLRFIEFYLILKRSEEMPSADDENVDHIQRKLNKILETRYDTDKVRVW